MVSQGGSLGSRVMQSSYLTGLGGLKDRARGSGIGHGSDRFYEMERYMVCDARRFKAKKLRRLLGRVAGETDVVSRLWCCCGF